ncbi:MAG: hypothetical protein MHM6MM_008612 [Cercozoa sp. M6MM]
MTHELTSMRADVERALAVAAEVTRQRRHAISGLLNRTTDQSSQKEDTQRTRQLHQSSLATLDAMLDSFAEHKETAAPAELPKRPRTHSLGDAKTASDEEEHAPVRRPHSHNAQQVLRRSAQLSAEAGDFMRTLYEDARNDAAAHPEDPEVRRFERSVREQLRRHSDAFL